MAELSFVKIWWMAIRPKTLWAGICPVMIGTAMAIDAGQSHLPAAVTCLGVALSVQIGTNFANDYFDFIKGADTDKRLGPTRVTQAGLVSPTTMKLAFVGTMTVAALLGLSLVFRAGWPIIPLAILSIASGILYTAGPYPLGYVGLGDLFVLVFFGPVAVAGTYYVQTLEVTPDVIVAGLAPGLLSMAMLTVNNLRDIDEDKSTGKRTLPVRFGRTFARVEYVGSILGACLIPIYLCVKSGDHHLVLAASAVAAIMLTTAKTVFTTTDGASLNSVLAKTGKFLLIYSAAFSAGWLIDL